MADRDQAIVAARQLIEANGVNENRRVVAKGLYVRRAAARDAKQSVIRCDGTNQSLIPSVVLLKTGGQRFVPNRNVLLVTIWSLAARVTK